MIEITRDSELKRFFTRQAKMLKPARDWLISTKLDTSFSSVLEVGCGCGDVLHEFGKNKLCVGLDINPGYLMELKVNCVLGDAHFLPFQNDSFDLVYCHIALMWFRNPVLAIKEMARVSAKWICCMAEYDYGARVDFPDEFGIIRDKLAEGILADGGDPYMGRKLYGYFEEAGLKTEVGAYCHVMDHEQLEKGFESEWEFISEFTDMEEVQREEIKRREFDSISEGTRFLFTPVFYAISKKQGYVLEKPSEQR